MVSEPTGLGPIEVRVPWPKTVGGTVIATVLGHPPRAQRSGDDRVSPEHRPIHRRSARNGPTRRTSPISNLDVALPTRCPTAPGTAGPAHWTSHAQPHGRWQRLNCSTAIRCRPDRPVHGRGRRGVAHPLPTAPRGSKGSAPWTRRGQPRQRRATRGSAQVRSPKVRNIAHFNGSRSSAGLSGSNIALFMPQPSLPGARRPATDTRSARRPGLPRLKRAMLWRRAAGPSTRRCGPPVKRRRRLTR